MVSSLGLPPVQPPVNRGELHGIPGALAVVPEVLLHHSHGEFYLGLKKIVAGFVVTQVALYIGRLGDGEAGLVLPLLPWLFLAAAGWHRWDMVHRDSRERAHSYSPGISHADRHFTALRLAWAQPPLMLQRCLSDNMLLYLVVQPALVLLIASGLLFSADVDGARFLFCAGLAMGWHALRRQVARRRTVAALWDAPIQQADMVAVTRQDVRHLRPQQRPHIAQGFQVPAASASAPLVSAGLPSPLAQLQRMQTTVTGSLTTPVAREVSPEGEQDAATASSRMP